MGPWQPEGWPGMEVGWGIVRERWGRGYATEAAVAVMDYVVDRLGWTEIIHTIVPENVKSQAVARKLGSTILRQTTLPAPIDHIVTDAWGQTAEQWIAKRTGAR